MGQINWFIVANTLLTFSAGVWYIWNSQTVLGLIQLTFTISNILFLLLGLQH